MLRVKPNALRQHCAGAYATDWHYRTTDPLADIEAAGDAYWLTVVHLLRRGDEIHVEAESGAWSYMLTVTKADEVGRVVETREGSRHSGKYVESDLLAEEQARSAEAKAAAVAEVQRVEIAEQAVETDDVMPAARWLGPSVKGAIVGYGVRIVEGLASKAEAQAALDSGEYADRIAEHREAFLTNNVSGRKAA